MTVYDKISDVYFKRRYDIDFNYNRDIEVPAMIKAIGKVKNKVILDLGCGFGDHAVKLSKKSAKKIIGIDISKKLIKLAKEKKPKNCEFFVGDMRKKLKLKNNSFDIVFSSLAIHYIKNLGRLFKEINRVLKKGGLFLFSTGHPIFNQVNQSPVHLVGVERNKDKRKIFGNYFKEALVKQNLGALGIIKLYNYTLQTLIQTALKNNFELIDYIETKPVPSSKKLDPVEYKITSTLPTFIIFKFKKK